MTEASIPPRVRPGDAVAVIAPASPVPGDRLRAGLERAGTRWRLRVPDDIERAHGFLAGDDARRADEVNRALRDPDVRALWLARGGYGILRLLPLLDADALRRDPKPIIGFSDATALLAWAELEAGVRGVHGPVLVQLGKLPPADAAWLFDLVEGRAGAAAVLATGLRRVGAPAVGAVEGRLVGGNLCLLAHLCGTRYQVPVEGAIVLVEEVDEKPYAIDRDLTHMALAGGWRGAAGALVGDFTACEDPKYPTATWADVVDERLRAFGVPALAGAPVGHGAVNRAFSFGGRVALDPEAGSAVLLDPAVG
ncbi:MAG TPA: LD-carboxypeptidase [Kofleriaceae bacterium]|nr:LD-carboxypeptidase [Kofleriaceae bacterium]